MTNTVMTGPSSTGQAIGMEDVPDPQVPERAKRRTYTAKYKRDILTEYDRLDRQERGAFLRREKLYTSLVGKWRDQRDRGVLEALARPAGAPPASALPTASTARSVASTPCVRQPPSRSTRCRTNQ